MKIPAGFLREFSHPDEEWGHQNLNANGARLHFVRNGEGAPIFLIHGWPDFWWSWHRNIPDLSEHFQVIAPDLRGFGESEKGASKRA